MGVFAVPYDFTDECSDSGAFLFHAVFFDILAHRRKQLTDKVKLDLCKLMLLRDSFQLGKAFFQDLALFVKLIYLLHDILFGVCAFGLAKGQHKCLDILFVILDLCFQICYLSVVTLTVAADTLFGLCDLLCHFRAFLTETLYCGDNLCIKHIAVGVFHSAYMASAALLCGAEIGIDWLTRCGKTVGHFRAHIVPTFTAVEDSGQQCNITSRLAITL